MLRRFFITLAVLVAVLSGHHAQAEKLRDVAAIAGARDNQLVGYGIVTGLAGTGDDVSVPFAAQSTLSLLRRLGIQIEPGQLRLRNIAAVLVTANLPPFSKPGTRLDVNVASVGNARSIQGGVLVQAILKGSDQRAYAVAQGSILVGGFDAKGSSGSSAKSGSVTAGRIPNGAIVEREVPTNFVEGGAVRLELKNPGFSAAARVAEAVNGKLGAGVATADDGGMVVVRVPQQYTSKTVELIAALEDMEVSMVRPARIIINERTGTIVAGGDVRLSPVAIVHGALTIVVKETPTVSQPTAPFGQGQTVVVPRSEVQTSEPKNPMTYLPAAPTLADVAQSLSNLGLPPRELASVLQALRSAGAMEAEIIVQ